MPNASYMPTISLGIYGARRHLWRRIVVRRTRWDLHARFEHNQNRPKQRPALVRKPPVSNDVVKGHAPDAGPFGNSFERHLATFSAPICGVKSQTPKFLDYFERRQERWPSSHWAHLANSIGSFGLAGEKNLSKPQPF